MTPDALAAIPASLKRQSVTIFSGNPGEEKAQRTFNYNFLGDTVKTTSILEYAADTLSQPSFPTRRSSDLPIDTDKKVSVTFFSGNEGEEKAQRTFNYNFNGDA